MKPRPQSLVLVPALFFASAGALQAQSTVLYASDFEADDGGFLPMSGEWEHGVPTAGPAGAHSGARCWATDLDGEPAAGEHLLLSPPIDATAALGADAILIRWWQYFDEHELLFPFNQTYQVHIRAGIEELFVRHYNKIVPNLPHSGWREVTALLAPEDLTGTSFQLSFEWAGTYGDGFNLDDVSVIALRTTTVASEDFESGPAGFTGTWQLGAPSGCPLAVQAASGSACWATSIDFCSYGVDQTLVTPIINLRPYLNRDEVYVAWQRVAQLEGGDGVHHDVSYNGGTTFEIATGWHHGGGSGSFPASPSVWSTFGFALDPSRGSTVVVRWHLTADTSEFEYGMWIDDFVLLVPEEVSGSGNNPPGSLFVSAGSFELGASVELAVDDPGASFPAGSPAFVAVALGPDAHLPAGTPIPGLGMAAPGATGDLLVSLGTLAGVVGGAAWSPAAPAKITIGVPASPTLAGVAVWLQGALVDAAPSGLRVGLTTGLFELLGS